MAMAREAARQQRLAESERRRVERERARSMRDAERAAAQRARDAARTAKELERLAKQEYLEGREEEVATLNAEIAEKLAALASVLDDTLDVDDAIDFDDLRLKQPPPLLALPDKVRHPAPRPRLESFTAEVPPLGGFARILPGAKRKHEQAIADATSAYERALERWRVEEEQRVARIAFLTSKHETDRETYLQKVAQRDAEVDDFAAAYRSGDPQAIVSYSTMVLERSRYPDDFPHHFSVAFAAASKQLVVELELPGVDVVPKVEEYRYTKARDTITERPRKPAEIKERYQDLVASIALRTIHEIFEADIAAHIETVCFNGYVCTVDPATGLDIRPHIVSVRTTREKFCIIDLRRVDKRTCLKNLGAQVSRNPEEAQPVKPVVEFDMADARFIDQADLVSTLSSATNLMDLSPSEFEHLVANLFRQMGLESKLTRSSRDGGVDCVAYDPRPVLGGKVVIQAKRYRHTVGVSAVRDLYGTMLNEGASKGLLVTTSGYGPDAFDFAKDKPIELIDGGGLLYLLQEIGMEARIVFPDA